MLYRIRVKGTDQDGEPWNRSLIYKCLPDNLTRRQAFKSDVLFRNEVAFYTQALPALLEFQVGTTHCLRDMAVTLQFEPTRDRQSGGGGEQ
jgi:hypothetical protein